METQIKNTRGQDVGFIKDVTYHSQRDWKRGQIFHNPKYKSAVALDVSILKQLIQNNIKNIRILITNFEESSFYLTTTVEFFLAHSHKIMFDKRKEGINYTGYGEQRYMEMNLWTRVYPDQKTLV